MTVERTALAPDLDICRVLTGLWQVADMEREGSPLDPEIARESLAAYAEAGFTTFDMADHYGSAEKLVGRFAESLQNGRRVEALTKWVPKPGPISKETVRRAVDRARERLRCERIDLLQFHPWSYWDPSYLDALFELERLSRSGGIGHLGMTNCDSEHLQMLLATGFPIVSNQVSFSLLDRRAAGAMTSVCRDHGVRLLAYGTLAGGFLSDRWLGRDEPEQLETWSQMKYKRFIDAGGGWDALQRVLHAAASVARRHGVSIANIAARYVLEQPAVAGVIVGARLGESEHIADTGRLFEFELSPADRDALDAAVATLEPIPGDCGDEYRHPPFLTASGDLSHHVESFPPAWEPTEQPGRRLAVSSGTDWEEKAGYSRAVRAGDRIAVSGTTAIHGDRAIGGDDAASQAVFALDKIEGAIRALGGSPADIVRTRVYLRHIGDIDAVARVHGARFASIRPANTVVQAALVGEALVEIEADALVGREGQQPGA